MSSFIPFDLNQAGSIVDGALSALPPSISSAAGSRLGQVGNNPVVNKIQQIADGIVPGLGSQLFKQQSAFPYRKPVTFFLKDRDGSLARPDPNNSDGFGLGYKFKMLVNPSNFAITQPPKTIVPIRTLGGWKLQHWYPELGSIKADGIIGNMLERFNRDLKDSKAWRSFKKLIAIYNKNGFTYTPPGTANRRSVQDGFIPTVVCIFDKNQYEGYFENLDYTESEDTPHTIKYSFNFKFVNNLTLDDIPGITRESSVDASIVNALVPQAAIGNAINSIFN